MVAALVSIPVSAEAPSKNDTTIREMDNYVISYHVPSVSQQLQRQKGYDATSCVSYAKYRRPDQNFVWVAPRFVEAYDYEPRAGLLVITNEGRWGHVGYVDRVTEDAIVVTEANWVPGLVTTREIPKDSPIIRGFR